MKTIITDGGRSTSSHPHEYRDCTVRALAIAGQMSYDEAHAILESMGRKFRKGFRSAEGLPKISGNASCKRSGSVGRFARENPVGRFYVQVSGHAFAIVDGLAYDTVEIPNGKHVRNAWRMG